MPPPIRVQAIHQYRPYVPTYTFWDDHKHTIWALIFIAIFAGAIVALFQSATLCGCAPSHPQNEMPESAEV